MLVYFRSASSVIIIMEIKDEYFRFYISTRLKLNVTAIDCYQELTSAYGNSAPSRATVFRWYAKFRNEGESQQSSSMQNQSRCGRPKTARTAAAIEDVEGLLNEDPKCTVRELAEWCDHSSTTIHRILKEDLQRRNVSCTWVPHVLSDDHKVLRINCAKQIRRLFFREGKAAFCNRLVVHDESWFYLKGQPCRASNRCWLEDDQPRLQVVRRQLTDRKVMLLFAFSPVGRFSVRAVPPGQTVDSDAIIAFIQHTGDLWRKLRQNPIKLHEVLWMWDNARPHASRAVTQFFQQRDVTTVFQSPYSPDFNLCDRFIFSWLKSDFAQREFASHTEVEEAATRWARGLSEDSLLNEVQKLIDHCQRVIDCAGDYVTE